MVAVGHGVVAAIVDPVVVEVVVGALVVVSHVEAKKDDID